MGSFTGDYNWHGIKVTEINSQVVMSMLPKKTHQLGLNAVLAVNCRRLIDLEWKEKVKHIYREGNMVGD